MVGIVRWWQPDEQLNADSRVWLFHKNIGVSKRPIFFKGSRLSVEANRLLIGRTELADSSSSNYLSAGSGYKRSLHRWDLHQIQLSSIL